jgi:hypothetical protein
VTGAIRRLTSRTRAHNFGKAADRFLRGMPLQALSSRALIAHRYPHKFWLKFSAYGLATGVSLARVEGKKHFASDILVGGTLGICTWQDNKAGRREAELDSWDVPSFQGIPLFLLPRLPT